jgi:hypothetical protein
MIAYNTELSDFLTLPKHLSQSYTDVITQVYPLRADAEKLKAFCAKYLENPIRKFEPAAPWILMQVCKYGKMSWTKKDSHQPPHRWFAQHELAFGIPVTCSTKTGERWELNEFAMIYPFIFVDNPLSMEAGRQIYGWSKSAIAIDPTAPEFQPNERRSVISVSGTPLPTETSKTFLQVFQKRPFLSGRSGVADAITSIPRAVGSYFAFTASLLDSVANLFSGYALPGTGSTTTNVKNVAADIQSLGRVVQQSYGYMNNLAPTFFGLMLGREISSEETGGPDAPIYTMKQVRDAAQPDTACYQAIVRSTIKVTDVKDGGLLFDPLSGDPTGGIEIALNGIQDNLSDLLRILSLESHGATRPASVLRPLMPFWASLNLSYGLANYQCWRSNRTGWRAHTDNASSQSPEEQESHLKIETGNEHESLKYLNRGSGSKLEISGSRVADNATLHFFLLQADRGILQILVDKYLNELTRSNLDKNKCFKFDIKAVPGGPFVYFALLNYDHMMIGDSDVGGDSVLTAAVLVEYYSVDKDGKRMGTPAFIPIYTFTGSDWNFITEYEVYGRLAFKSTFSSPANTWLKQSAPSKTEVLSLETMLFPADNLEARVRPLIKIYREPPSSESKKDSPSAEQDAQEYLKKVGLGEYLTPASEPQSAQSLQSIALKQVRNAIHGDVADYQSLVGIKRSFVYSGDLRPQQMRIHIYNYPSFPLLQKIGKENSGEKVSVTEGCEVRSFPVTAFGVCGKLQQEQGKELWWRVAPDEEWRRQS